MIIVMEGMDNTGKTTLGAYVAKQLRAVYIKVERPKRAVDLLAYQGILEQARSYSGVVVTDRHVAISEPIYGKICRGGHDLLQKDIDLCLGQIDAIVYCRPPDPVLMGTIADRAQMEGVLENAAALIHAYDEWYEQVFDYGRSYRFIGRYNFRSDDPKRVVAELQSFRASRGL